MLENGERLTITLSGHGHGKVHNTVYLDFLISVGAKRNIVERCNVSRLSYAEITNLIFQCILISFHSFPTPDMIFDILSSTPGLPPSSVNR